MNPSIAVVMDPIEAIHPTKDTTFALMLEAQRRGYAIFYVRPGSLSIKNGASHGYLDQYMYDGQFQQFLHQVVFVF